MITPEEMRTLAQSLEINPRGVTHNDRAALQLAIRGNQDAAAMLRSIATEREELRKLLYDIHPDPDHDVVQKYYAYFEANPLPKGAE